MTIVDHPLLKRDLSILRNRETPHGTFRKVLADVSAILAYEAMRDLNLASYDLETPLETTVGYRLADEIIVVPILRAGLGMVDGFVRFAPEARVGHLGMYRDESTLQPVDYYKNVPSGVHNAWIFVADPMLATGGSATGAVTTLKALGGRRFRFVCIVAAPEGVAHLSSHHPDVSIFAATLDRGLNGNGYICPGLGDAGDRIFGTELLG
ncbi:MAG TPA: uracil phosphoribosyltransferase [Rhodothermales bacterium]|nr:uracil phosphoribosyltransferase [Rhodothermales bacterium]